MSNYPKYLMHSPIGSQGDFVIPPKTATEAGLGRLSQQNGWGVENSQPVEQGGIPPFRTDFNGALYLLSQLVFWYQQGGIMNYSATIDYEVGNEVLQNGTKYRCLQPNGPSTQAVAPGTNRAVWRNMDITVPAGAVVPFCNVTLGGSDNRRPIFWGSTQADEGWVLADGGSDGRGGLTPNLIDRFIKGSAPANQGKMGGRASLSINNIPVNGTIGGTALTVSQLPPHTHGGSTSPAGNHAHTRGSMNITGEFGGLETYDSVIATRCFYKSRKGVIGTEGSDEDNWAIGMDAARAWTGETSYNGQHQHGLSIQNTGGGQTHTHTLSANTSITGVQIEPPFFCMAYFVRLPE